MAALWTFPADPALPEELHGRRMVLVAAVYAGDPADADDVLAPFRQLATPLIDMSATMPYVTVQSDFDAVFPDGGRYYFKSHMMDELTDAAIAAVVRCANARANEESFIVIRTLGGAIARVSPEDSAYPHRAASFNVSIDCVWSDPHRRRRHHRLGAPDLGHDAPVRERWRVPQLRGLRR